MKNNAPVVVFAYNRAKHLADTLYALNKCPRASETELFVFCDGPKIANDERVNSVRKVVEEFVQVAKFKRVHVSLSEVNLGLAKSIISGVTNIVNEFGKVIVLEDDLTCAPSFLDYMNEALDYYQDNALIWSISGYSFPMKCQGNMTKDVYFMGRASSWGWATWKDRWEMVDWNVSDYSRFKFNPILRARFAKWGGDLPIMLDQQMSRGINSWAIRWCYEQSKRRMMTVYPVKSQIVNNGADGSGEHAANTLAYVTMLDESGKKNFSFCEVYSVRGLIKECRRKYQNKWTIYLRVYLKNLFLRYGFLK